MRSDLVPRQETSLNCLAAYARLAIVPLLVLVLLTPRPGHPNDAPAPGRSYREAIREDLLAAIRSYREALDRVLPVKVAEVLRATAEVEKLRELRQRGLVSTKELENGERLLAIAEEQLEAIRREILQADGSLTEALETSTPSSVQTPAPSRQAPQRSTERPASPPPSAADSTPPRIVLNYPGADARVDQDVILITGVVTDDIAVGRIHVLVNGAEAAPAIQPPPGTRGIPVRANVSLRAGKNLLEITATDRAGNVTQLVRTVTRVVPAPPTIDGKRLAVIVGIGAYDHAAVPRLRYAVRDAEAMYAVLTTHAGFKKDNVLLLTDSSRQRPNLRNIKSALGTFLARSAKQEDTVVVFFAGHGAPELDPRGVERDGLAKYLIPSDADPNDLYATALAMDEIQTIFSRIEAERVLMFVDACYSGATGGRTFVSQRVRTRDVTMDGQFLDRLTGAKGRAIITASRPSEVSLELSELGHGLFTYYLVEALRGAADSDKDGIVTLHEVYAYVSRAVAAKSRAVGGNQHPVMKGEVDGLLPLARITPR